jgi:RHS repeat-associated protein
VLYTLRGTTPSYNHYNRRGDVIGKSDGSGDSTYLATYEAFGTRTVETGSTQDRQKANTKDEEPELGLLNEGFRYRDLETGSFITRDPLGFVDGPNMYSYVVANPWTKFDPEGLFALDAEAMNEASKGAFVMLNAPNIGDKIAGAVYMGATVADGLSDISPKGLLKKPIQEGVEALSEAGAKALAKREAKAAAKAQAAAEKKAAAEAKKSKPAQTGKDNASQGTPNEAPKPQPKGGEAAAERAENIKKGIPESQLGPSGKPKIHTVDHSTKKAAKDAARQDGKGAPIHHPNDKGQPPHYHAVDEAGKKIGKQSPHHNYPESKK